MQVTKDQFGFQQRTVEELSADVEIQEAAKEYFLPAYHGGKNGMKVKYMNLDGTEATYRKKTSDNRDYYYNFRVFDPSAESKYIRPAADVQLYLTGLYEFFVKQNKNDEVKKVYLVEGEKKAYAMCAIGIPTVGFSGINCIVDSSKGAILGGHYKDYTVKSIWAQVRTYFQDIEGVTLVHDADAFDGGIDRKMGFRASVIGFAVAYSKLYPTNVQYAYIDHEEAKGADDVIVYEELSEADDLLDFLHVFDLNDSENVNELMSKFAALEDAYDKVYEAITKYYPEMWRNELTGALHLNAAAEDSINDAQLNTIINRVHRVCQYEEKTVNQRAGTTTIRVKPKAGREIVQAILLAEDIIPTLNPIKKAIEELATETKEEVKTGEMHKFIGHLTLDYKEMGITETTLSRMLRKWMIGVVAQVFDPNATNVLMPVFTGAVNIGKTYMMQNMFPKSLQRFVKAIPTLKDDKEIKEMIASSLILFDDEMTSTTKKEAHELRQLLSTNKVTYRPSYGRCTVTKKRIASFIGATNDKAIISDPRNNRRLIPISVLHRDTEKFDQIDIEAMWNEAYWAYVSGEKYELDQGEVEELVSVSEGAKIATVEADFVADALGEAPREADMHDANVDILSALAIMRVLKGNIKLSKPKLQQALREAGFIEYAKPKKIKGKTKRGYLVSVEKLAEYNDSLVAGKITV